MYPTGQPSNHPTTQPSRQPSRQPTAQPSRQPRGRPTRQPVAQPTSQPSRQPRSRPTKRPNPQPTSMPSREFMLQLDHRYTFDKSATDILGGRKYSGLISSTGVTIDSGRAIFNAAYLGGGDLVPASITIPAGSIYSNQSTIEMWVTAQNSPADSKSYTLFSLQSASTSLTLFRSASTQTVALEYTSKSHASTVPVTGYVDSGVPFDTLNNSYVAIVVNSNHPLTLFVHSNSLNPISTSQTNFYAQINAAANIGCTSPCTASTSFVGSVSEFRIWQGALSHSDLISHNSTGPYEILTKPTGQPTGQPSSSPTRQPSRQPASRPSSHPSRSPLSRPSRQPTTQPSSKPTHLSPCPKGYGYGVFPMFYTEEGYGNICRPCPPGTFSNTVGLNNCTLVPAGTVSYCISRYFFLRINVT